MILNDFSIHSSQNSCSEAKNFIENDQKMKKQIIILSKDLIEVKYHKDHPNINVQFIYQSINDFLFQKNFIVFNPFLQDSVDKNHRLLSTSCLNYIKHTDVQSMRKRLSSIFKMKYQKRQNFKNEINQTFPVMQYAIRFLF